MLKNLMILFMLVTIVGCSNEQSSTDLVFTNSDTPYSVELLSYKNNNHMSFVTHNSNRVNDFNEIYLTSIEDGEETKQLIFEPQKEQSYIKDLEANDHWIMWQENYKTNRQSYTDIYVYNRKTKETDVIQTVKNELDVPLNTGLEKDQVIWVEQKMQERKTVIKLYSLDTNEVQTVISNDFLKIPNQNFNMPTFTANITNDTIVYDLKTKNGYYYVLFDVKTKQEINRMKFPENDIFLSFNLDYSPNQDTLALYILKQQKSNTYNEEVGYLDLKDGMYKTILQLDSKRGDRLFGDHIEISDKYITFNLEKYVTGAAYDNYIGYVYDINKDETMKQNGSFETKYRSSKLTNITFDKENGANKIHLMINDIR